MHSLIFLNITIYKKYLFFIFFILFIPEKYKIIFFLIKYDKK